MDISERIRLLRMHKKMTQGELVEGISSVTYLSRIENKQIKPSLSFLKQIAGRLQVDLEYLVSMESGLYREKLQGIVAAYRMTGLIQAEDVSFLKMHSLELHPTEIHLQIYATLLQVCLNMQRWKEAEKTFELSRRFIPDDGGNEHQDHYFHYYTVCGQFYFSRQDFIESGRYYSMAERLLPFVGEPEAARLFFLISLVKEKISQDKWVCVHYSQRAYDYYRRSGDRTRMAQVLMAQVLQYQLLQDAVRATRCLNEALSIAQEAEDQRYLATVEYNISRIHQTNKEYEKCIRHLERCIEIYHQLSSETDKVTPYKHLIEIYTELKAWSEADYYLDLALSIAREYRLHYDCIDLYAIKANAFKMRADEGKYEKEMQRVITLCIEHNQLYHVKKLANELGAHFYDKRAYKKAADFFTVAMEYDHKLQRLTALHPLAKSPTEVVPISIL